MTKMSIMAAAIALGASLGSAPAQSANIIVAGDLEDGRIQVFAVEANGQIDWPGAHVPGQSLDPHYRTYQTRSPE